MRGRTFVCTNEFDHKGTVGVSGLVFEDLFNLLTFFGRLLVYKSKAAFLRVLSVPY